MACRSFLGSSTRTHIYLICSRPLQSTRLFSATRYRRLEETDKPASADTITTQTSAPSDQSTAEPTATQPSSTKATSSNTQNAQRIPERNSVMDMLSSVGSNLGGPAPGQPSAYGLTSVLDKYKSPSGPRRLGDDEWHLHVYSHRRNTHLTLTDTDRKCLISISTGNIGFQKANRGSYDAAYQLMAYLLSRIQQQGLVPKIQKLELCLRGFGPGRDAVAKVLQGQEGTRLREALVRVVDKTRLKIGGNRSPRPRRL